MGASTTSTDMPTPEVICCYYAHFTKDGQRQAPAVFLMLAFFASVILVETWGAVYDAVRQMLSGQAAIRLDEADGAERQPLSMSAEERGLKLFRDLGERMPTPGSR